MKLKLKIGHDNSVDINVSNRGSLIVKYVMTKHTIEYKTYQLSFYQGAEQLAQTILSSNNIKQTIVSMFFNNNLFANVKYTDDKVIFNYDIDDDRNKIIKHIKSVNTRSNLQFHRIINADDTKIKVQYIGHKIGFVREDEIVPRYVNDIQYTTNYVTTYECRDRSVFTFDADCYMFNIDLTKPFNNQKYVPTGRLLRVDNEYGHRLYNYGDEWALLHIIVSKYDDYVKLLNLVGVFKVGNDIVIDGNKIAHIIKYKPTTYNNTRNAYCFNGVYDVYGDRSEIITLVCRKIKEMCDVFINGLVDKVDVWETQHSGKRIRLISSDKYSSFLEDYDGWTLPSKKLINEFVKKHDEYVNNLSYITLPSGTITYHINDISKKFYDVHDKIYRSYTSTSKDYICSEIFDNFDHGWSNDDVNFAFDYLTYYYSDDYYMKQLIESTKQYKFVEV